MCTYLYNKINYNIFSYNRQLFAPVRYTRACLKKAFRELRVPVCGRFYPNEGGVAGYGNRMRVKYTAKWGLQIAEMIFQTRSNRTGHFLTAVFLYKIMKTLGFFCAIFLTSFNDFRFKNCYTGSIMLHYMLLEVFTNESQKL